MVCDGGRISSANNTELNNSEAMSDKIKPAALMVLAHQRAIFLYLSGIALIVFVRIFFDNLCRIDTASHLKQSYVPHQKTLSRRFHALLRTQNEIQMPIEWAPTIGLT